MKALRPADFQELTIVTSDIRPSLGRYDWLPTWPRLKAPILTAAVARLAAANSSRDPAIPPGPTRGMPPDRLTAPRPDAGARGGRPSGDRQTNIASTK